MNIAVIIKKIEPLALKLNWPRERLWSDRHLPIGVRGLDAVLESDDDILDLTSEYITILHDGAPVRFFRLQS